ncbi:MAG: hypothetical protein PHW50_02190 [Patescibacteria group bacterium]|nr:hypothetical protein [Patescibacteria group bacterium]
MEQQVSINRSPYGSSKNSGKAWFIISLIIIALLLVGAGFGYWYLNKSFNNQKNELQKQIDDLKKELADYKSKASVATETEQTDTFNYAGWETYVNDVYDYQFKYPNGAVISEAQQEEFTMSPEESDAGKTFEEIYAELTGKICVSLQYNEANIYISAPVNADFSRVICGRTGVGSDEELTPVEENLVINGKTYTATGDRGTTSSTLVLELDDGTRIEYGGDLTDEDTALVIKRIIESYEQI